MNKSIYVFGILFLVIVAVLVGVDYKYSVTENMTTTEITDLHKSDLLESASEREQTDITGSTTTKLNSDKNKKETTSKKNSSEKAIDCRKLFKAITKFDVHNEELQKYLSEQTKFSGNTVSLTANKIENGYVSGRAESKEAFRYGTFAFKVNTLEGTGLFPSVWLKPLNNDDGYPEIDIYELLGSTPYEFNGVMHYVDNGKKERDFFTHRFSKKSIPEAYTIKFEWTPDKLIWYLNGQMIYAITNNVPNEPMFMVMNLAVGGTWPGSPDESTKFPSTFNVEFLEYNPTETFSR